MSYMKKRVYSENSFTHLPLPFFPSPEESILIVSQESFHVMNFLTYTAA